MSIYIIRHGETAGNASAIVQFPHTPLNERGLAQADRVGERLRTARICKVLASDYARALTTAQHVQRATGAPLEIHPGLRERNFGVLRGRPRAEVGELMYDDDYEPPQGESWAVFHARVERCWAEVGAIAQAAGGNIAVVTHGLVCCSLVLRQLCLLPGDEVAGRGFGNTSVTLVDAAPPWTVRVLNCVAHLDAGTEARGSVL